MRVLGVALLCFLAAVGVHSSQVEELAETACKTKTGTKHQFHGSAELAELVEYMSGLQVGHKLYECRAKHLEALEQLVQVAESNNDDICGEQKIASIEDYHRRFVSKVSKKSKLKAPKMAKLFFMQYATEISSICEQAAIKTIGDNKQTLNAEQLAAMEKLRKFTDALGMSDLSKGYRGIYLFWNMIDSLSVAHNDKLAKYLSDGEVRTNVQMRNAKKVNGVQALCRYQLRPVYSRSLLPALRLIDMGFYPRDNKLAQALLDDPNVRGLFFAAQVCETILPVAVYSDEQLNEDQFVALTVEEANQLVLPEIEGRDVLAQNQPDVKVTPSSLSVDQLTFEESAVKAIQKNVKSRGKVVNYLLKHMAKQMRMKFQAAFDKFKLFRRDQNKQLEPIEGALESLEKLESMDNNDDELSRKRRKRSFFGDAWWIIKGMGIQIGFIIYYPLMLVFKLVFFAIPALILAYPAHRGNVKAKNAIHWMLNVADPLAGQEKQIIPPGTAFIATPETAEGDKKPDDDDATNNNYANAGAVAGGAYN